jgi:hypothetical protein
MPLEKPELQSSCSTRWPAAAGSGELEDEGIRNDMYVLLMRPGEEEENRHTIERFIEVASGKKYKYIVMHASWLPWLPDLLREKTGAKIFSLDSANRLDIPEGLARLDAHSAIFSAIRGAKTVRAAEIILKNQKSKDRFHPKFDYTFLGAPRPLVQEIAFTSIQSCPYRKDVKQNPLFMHVVFDEKTSTRGCSYCAGAKTYTSLSEKKKRAILAEQIRYLQQNLATLKEIAVPFPEDYLEALTRIILDADELGIKPVTFSGQFRAGAVVEHEDKISGLIGAALERGFTFILGVVGLESFDRTDLMYFNRDGEEEVNEAVRAIRRLRKTYDPELFMPETVGSFILFHPWQTMEGLKKNIRGMLSAQITGIFSTVNVNDIRIHPGVPLYALAESEGLVLPVGRRVRDVPLGGYFAEHPWKFKDKSVETVHRLFSRLSHKTPETVGLLGAIHRFVKTSPGRAADVDRMEKAMDRLGILVRENSICRTGEGEPVLVGETCNQACEPCLFTNGCFTGDYQRSLRLASKRIASGRRVITIAGREPTMLKWLGRLVVEIKSLGSTSVQVLTNARMLVYPRIARALAASGIDRFLVKYHSHTAGVHDRVCRVEGAFSQTLKATRTIKALKQPHAPAPALSFVMIVGEHNLDALNDIVDFAAGERAGEIRFALPMAALGLGGLERTESALRSALERAGVAGIPAGLDPHLSFKWSL